MGEGVHEVGEVLVLDVVVQELLVVALDVQVTVVDVTVGGETLAELDVDDTDGYGPETTTVYDPSGDYVFSVVDFTASGDLAISGATVKVYLPGQQPVTISISECANTATDRYDIEWSVFRVHNGELEIYNRIQDVDMNHVNGKVD